MNSTGAAGAATRPSPAAQVPDARGQDRGQDRSEPWLIPPPVEAYVLRAPDAVSLAATAARIADLAPSLSDAELHDLACQLGREASPAGGCRLGIVACGQEQLAARARDGARLAASARPGRLATGPGVFAGNGVRGRVVLLFPGLGTGQEAGDAPGASAPPPLFGLTDPQAVQPAILHASLSGLRWLDRLGVTATAAVGHSLGEITGLVWAGCLSEAEATRLTAQRAAVIRASGARQTAMVSLAADVMTSQALCAGTDLVIAAYNGPGAHVLAGPVASVRDVTRRVQRQGIRAVVLDVSHAFHSPAMAGCVTPLRAILGDVAFAAPRRRIASTVTGRMVTAGDDIARLLCAELTSPVRFTEALAAVTADADLLCETGPGHGLAGLAAAACDVPAVSLEARTADEWGAAQAAAALFAAGAVDSLEPVLAGRTARPVDIWQERITPAGPPAARTAGPETADVVPIGRRAPECPADPGWRGRFLRDIRRHRPGAELVADSRLSLASDPYLADCRDGRADRTAELPAVMALEAMAQAASALAGRPVRRAVRVSLGAPVLVPAGTGDEVQIRVYARREGKRVTAVLRSQAAGRWVDHGRASFPLRPAGPAAGPAADQPAEGDGQTARPDWRTFGQTTGILDSADLYGPVCSQSGRFRRVAFLPELTSRRCCALVRGGDDQPWFGPATGSADAALVLGSPGLNDAALHVLQACFPHRRVRAAGCDSVTVSGRQVTGAVEVRACQRATTRAVPAGGPGTGSAAGGPRAAQPATEYLWDVTAVDASGQPVISWTGLRLRDDGPAGGAAPLPPALLGVYLERGATALGLDPALRISVRCEQPLVTATAAPGTAAPRTATVAPGPAGAACPVVAAPSRRPGWVSAHSRGQLDELSLRLRAASPAACAWETADSDQDGSGPDSSGPDTSGQDDSGPDTSGQDDSGPDNRGQDDSGPDNRGQDDSGPDIRGHGDEDPELEALRQRLRDSLAEPGPTVRARIRTAIECLSKAGRPVGCELVVDGCYDNGWALLHAGDALIACASVRVIGVSSPVAVSIMTGTGVPAAGAA